MGSKGKESKMAMDKGGMVGRTVETGKRNVIQNQDMMISGNIELPVKPYVIPSEVVPGVRDTPLDAGGSANPDGNKTK
jgi:hypothetical protein